MPTSAVTGTRNVKTARVKVTDDSRTETEREADKNAQEARAEIRTLQDNGSIQVVTKGGAIVNVDAGQPDWKDRVRELDPKHPVLKYENA